MDLQVPTGYLVVSILSLLWSSVANVWRISAVRDNCVFRTSSSSLIWYDLSPHWVQLVVDYATAMQSTMEPSQAELQARADLANQSKRWWAGGVGKPIDRCNRNVWQLFSYLVCSICVKSLFCFVFLFPLFSHFICEYYYYFYAVWRFGFVFIFLADLVRRCDCRRGRSSAKWMAPTTFNVFDGFISQMPTDTGRIDSYPNRTNRVRVRISWIVIRLRLNEYSHISSPPTH